MPPAVVTVTSTTPADSPGEVAVHEVDDEQLTEVPALAPKATVVDPTTKPVPEMVTTSAAVGGATGGRGDPGDRRCGLIAEVVGRDRGTGARLVGDGDVGDAGRSTRRGGGYLKCRS
jgi:hypothetical protein